MRKVLISLMMVALVAGLAYSGDLATQRIVADFSTATLASNRVSTVVQNSGYIREITFIPTGVFTSKVEIFLTYEGGAYTNIVYTNYTLTAATTVRPAVDRTDNAGAALTGDDPVSYLTGDAVLTVNVTNANQKASTALKVFVTTEK